MLLDDAFTTSKTVLCDFSGLLNSAMGTSKDILWTSHLQNILMLCHAVCNNNNSNVLFINGYLPY